MNQVVFFASLDQLIVYFSNLRYKVLTFSVAGNLSLEQGRKVLVQYKNKQNITKWKDQMKGNIDGLEWR